ncbi:unnamed protein product [Dovyalis caffra]|uniref:Uncharacterized protein n=1 Tax=Dovyalis caffra TaxID=77055 RepID=A0AAV1SNC2_9ROSI|nr:unnamed protein product [Dovyalis caffra]
MEITSSLGWKHDLTLLGAKAAATESSAVSTELEDNALSVRITSDVAREMTRASLPRVSTFVFAATIT